MKVFKQNEHSLLIKAFGLRGKLYLSATTLTFFDLNDPDHLLQEQELWGAVPDQIGSETVLDLGMPKPRGEVIVTGSCYAPKNTTRPASQVSIRVGPVLKTLNVHGRRYWTWAGGISPAEPFSEMPIIWANAFGGEGFGKNPLGKGAVLVALADGRTVRPLPNIEHPARQIGSPQDRPDPAGFGPLDLLWPQRASKNGTYDEKWQNERWPDFPDDMNYEFFNVAPEDQFLPGFFNGDETMEIVNMHPDLPFIRSALPPFRMRCFVTKKKSLKAKDEEDQIFQEVTTRIDTLWLFPHILRGVVMYRGVTEILDDEYADVVRIFLATEHRDETAKPIEYYFEQQKKMLDLTVPIDTGPLQEAQAKMAEAMKRFKNVPKEIEEAKQKAMGKRPQMPPPTPAEMAALSKGLTKDGHALLDRLEVQAQEMRAKWGHLVRVPLDQIAAFRQKLAVMEEKIKQAVDKVESAKAKGEEAKSEFSAAIKAKVSPEDLAKTGVDPDNLLPKTSINPWHDHGFPFVVQSRKALEQDMPAQQALLDLGLTRKTIKRAWLGINTEERLEDRAAWGLAAENSDLNQAKSLTLPAGLVLPRFKESVLSRIVIRPGDFDRPDRDVLVEGSDESGFFLPAVNQGAPVIRVRDELEALLLDQEIGDACSILAVKEPNLPLSDEAGQALEAAAAVLVVLPRSLAGSNESWTPWQQAFPQAVKLPLPQGETLFEARRRGVDLRQWVMEALPPEFAAQHRISPALPQPGQAPSGPPEALTFPAMDIKAMINKALKEVQAFYQPKFEALKSELGGLEDQARKKALELGQDPETVLAAAKNQPKSLADLGKQISQTIAGRREQLQGRGLLTPEAEAKMKAAEAQTLQMGQDGEAKLQAGLAELAAKKKELAEKMAQLKAGQPPEGVKEKLAAAGLDPDKMKRRTREEVIAMYNRGESLAGAIISEVDLSGLELPGIDFSSSQCRRTDFSGSILEGANFTRAMGQEAVFAKAKLQGACFEKGIFQGADFKEADLSQANLHQAIMNKANFSQADLSRACLDWAILQKSNLVKAKLAGIKAEMGIFSDADATAADFSGANFFKCVFNNNTIDAADFSRATFDSSLFVGVKGEGVKFNRANMNRARFTNGVQLPKADFTETSMHQACFLESDLSGADFQGSVMEQAMIEKCDLSRARMSYISAKKCRFNKSNLEGADLRGINLFMGSLRKARLVDTDLRASNLYAVDFFKAIVGRTRFDLANLKMTQLYNRTDFLE